MKRPPIPKLRALLGMAGMVLLQALPAQAQYQLSGGAFNDLTPVSPFTPIDGAEGLSGEYFNAMDLSGPPALTRTDANLNFSWPDSPGPGVNADQFSVRWTGFLNVPTAGVYTFYPTSDDGVRLWINGVQVVDGWRDQGATEFSSGPINLAAGQIPVKVEFYDNAVVADIVLRWEGPGLAKEIIPAANLVPAAPVEPPVTRPAISGQTQGPNVQSVAATSSTTAASSPSGALSAQFPSAIYRDGTGQPTGKATILLQSEAGYSFASGVPKYFLGDVVTRPLTRVDNLTPAGSTYWRAQPVQPGEVFTHTSGLPATSTPLAANVESSVYYSPHALRVFATQPGFATVTWVTRLPEGGRYIFKTETFGVSASTRLPVKQMFWTEGSFKGPPVNVPSGRITTIQPVFSSAFPRTVPEAYLRPGEVRDPNNPFQFLAIKTTLWLSDIGSPKTLRAYNVEGRVFIEYLGAVKPDGVSYEFLGADIVEVSQQAPATIVDVKLGEQILPEDGDTSLLPAPLAETLNSPLIGSTARADGRMVYYAEQENLNADKNQFYWLENLDAAITATGIPPKLELAWPKYLNKYRHFWPAEPGEFAQLVVPDAGSTGATGVFFNGALPQIMWQDDGALTEAKIDLDTQSFVVNPGSNGNRSLLKFTSGRDFWYVRMNTQPESAVADGSRDGTKFTAAATVGQRIERPDPGYEIGGHVSAGTGYDVNAFRNPYAVGVAASGAGAIIPVNARPGDNELTVWWFRKINPPTDQFTPFHVAARMARYTVNYPGSADKIIMASNAGSGDLNPSEIAGSLYVQNNPALPGFNPNEEHALLIAGRVYALRDDLNVTSGTGYTSQPYVLLSYADATDLRPSMRVFKVEREDATYKFDYLVTAGTILQGPMPLPILPPALDALGEVKNTEVTPAGIDDAPNRTGPVALYDKFTFKDRKGFHWVYRAPHAGLGNQRLEFRFYYPMQEGFFIPGQSAQPAPGTALPYLRPLDSNQQPQGDAISGEALLVKYQPVWPVCPELRVGETLTLPKFGLPAVRGQISAEVLYQQSIAKTGTDKNAVTLHDPTRRKIVDLATAGLDKLPSSVATTGSFGKIYFQLVPPHLQKRFYFDPLLGPKGSLVFIGQFVDEIAGEDYLNLNVLSAEETTRLKSVVNASDSDKTKWDSAIDGLSTTVETFVENESKMGTYIVGSSQVVGPSQPAAITNSDTAADSYALTATGQGDGYVTLLFGDGEAFTPKGEPVAMKIIKVAPQLYTGDLKVLLSDNPLDEQVTLRHSGDFAARPEDYDFEWRYAPPGDGVAPPVYTYTMEAKFGGAATNWRLVANPAAKLPTSAQYAAAALASVPRSLVIHNAAWSAEGNPPGAALLLETPVDFTAGVPQNLVFSAQLPVLDGFVLYVNGVPALATNAPAEFENTGSTSGLSNSGLARQWSLSPNYFTAGTNRIEIALYTAADRGALSNLDFRLEASVELDKVTAPGSPWLTPNGTLSNIAIVGGSASSPLGSPLLALSDNYFTMRYKAKSGITAGQYSRWMPAKLVEGWIKRVLAGINPFNQRIKDLLNNPVNTDVSLLTQAGKRWEGDVALNLQNINDFGLIEIYETVLKRGKGMSIESGYDYAPANDALLLAAGYLNDLYQILGNEAYADAANPTISIDDQTTVSEVNTSRFSFEGQVSSVLEEELSLLRGRDDFLSPGVLIAPAYNRLYWNYTRGINSGEALYAVNYNIKEKAGSPTANGVLDAADAQRMFPQAHGDAYGHYLTALKGYYYLLENPNFTWVPRSEAVTVLGQAVQIDYADERKFASAAANVARSAEQILALTHRQNYQDDTAAGWRHFRDGKNNPRTGVNRHQGLDEWTARSTQGALFNWLAGNAMLPEKDTNPNHTGVQIIDRTTVPELDELASTASKFQSTMDNANAHLNPLGLSPDSVAFDISPSALKAGNSHFEQIYDRALKSVLNAKGAFDAAARGTRSLRNQENQIDDYNAVIVDEERSYNTRLLEIFGSPYQGDIGPGKTYIQDYTGPDLVNWFVIDRSVGEGSRAKKGSADWEKNRIALGLLSPVDTAEESLVTIEVPVRVGQFNVKDTDPDFLDTNPADVGTIKEILNGFRYESDRIEVKIKPDRFLQYSDTYRPGVDLGLRPRVGLLQQALLDLHEAQVEILAWNAGLGTTQQNFRREVELFNELVQTHTKTLSLTKESGKKIEEIERTVANLNSAAFTVERLADRLLTAGEVIKDAVPEVFGLAFSAGAPAKGAIKGVALATNIVLETTLMAMQTASNNKTLDITKELNKLQQQVDGLGFSLEQKQAIYEFEQTFATISGANFEYAVLADRYQRTGERVRTLLAEAQEVLANREVFRKRAAAIIQGYRTRDLTFRTFRNEALEQYRTLYDLAGRYTYLAAKSYDYETGLLGTRQGSTVFSSIVASRSLGDLTGNLPQATVSTLGDSGLAGTMARLQSDWTVAEGRLGINNPDAYGTLFSLRGEAFRILNSPTTTKDDAAWRQLLERHIVRDVTTDPDVSRNCAGIWKTDGSAVPGIILPFGTTIEQMKNFFGVPLAGGDHTFSSSSFATKIYSAGMCFPGYVGMDAFANGTPVGGSPNVNSPLALSATPYIYLIPCGSDTMRAPALGDTGIIRTWDVKDQALPLPFNLGASEFSTTQFFTAQNTLTEQPWIVRKHQSFRAVADPQLFYSLLPDEFTCRRLVGRSVWNTQWKIVIPAYTLLANEQEGLNRFVASVKDIQLFLRTYSHAGN